MENNLTPGIQPSVNGSSKIKAFGLWLWEMLKVVIVSLAIILPVRMYIFQPFVVQGASMEPNFHENEYLIIDEISQRFDQIKRGQVIVFHPPQDAKAYYIKRIIGLPGETVEIKDGKIRVYNQQQPEGFVLDEQAYLSSSDLDPLMDQKVTLKENEYYVMGDNREKSFDSRRFGPILLDHVKGKVLLRAFPFSEFSFFSNPTYNQ